MFRASVARHEERVQRDFRRPATRRRVRFVQDDHLAVAVLQVPTVSVRARVQFPLMLFHKLQSVPASTSSGRGTLGSTSKNRQGATCTSTCPCGEPHESMERAPTHFPRIRPTVSTDRALVSAIHSICFSRVSHSSAMLRNAVWTMASASRRASAAHKSACRRHWLALTTSTGSRIGAAPESPITLSFDTTLYRRGQIGRRLVKFELDHWASPSFPAGGIDEGPVLPDGSTKYRKNSELVRSSMRVVSCRSATSYACIER